MPNFLAELEMFRSPNPVNARQIGMMYRVLVAEPGSNRGVSVDAFFFPDDGTKTVIGTKVSECWKYDEMDPAESVFISLRSLDPADTHQIELEIFKADIVVSDKLYPDHIMLQGNILRDKIQINNWPKPRYYSSKPTQLHMERTPNAVCYPM